MKANSPTLPPIPARTGPARPTKRSGPVPAWGLKLGGFLTTFGIFLGSFGYASAHLYVADAPLQPATVAVTQVTTTTSSTAATSATQTTTTLASAVRTTIRAAVTVTKKS